MSTAAKKPNRTLQALSVTISSRTLADPSKAHSPQEESKGDGSLGSAADSVGSADPRTSDVDGKRNRTGKPEDGCDDQKCNGRQLMEEAFVVQRRDPNVDQDKE